MSAAEARLYPPALPWATLAIGAVALTVHVWPGAFTAFELDRVNLAERGWWTLGSAHLAHFSGSHLFWNLAILMPAGAWAERLAPWRLRLFYLTAPFVISIVLLALDRDLLHYAGLSGLAAGVVAFLAWLRLAELEPGARWFWRAVLASIAVKIGFETMQGRPTLAEFEDEAVQPVPLAHVIGVLSAAGFYLLPLRALHQRWRQSWRTRRERRARQAAAPYGAST